MANSFYILIGHSYRKIKKQVLRIQDLIILIITRRRESKPEFFSHLTFNPLITHAHLVKLSVLLTFSRDNKPIYSLSTAQDRKMCQLKRDSQLRLIRKRNIERAKKFRSKHEARWLAYTMEILEFENDVWNLRASKVWVFSKTFIITIKGNYCLPVDNLWCNALYKSKDGTSTPPGVAWVVSSAFEEAMCFVDSLQGLISRLHRPKTTPVDRLCTEMGQNLRGFGKNPRTKSPGHNRRPSLIWSNSRETTRYCVKEIS